MIGSAPRSSRSPLAVWTSGSAGVAGRLFGLLDDPAREAARYALVAGAAVAVAIRGYRWPVAATAVLTVVGGLLLILSPGRLVASSPYSAGLDLAAAVGRFSRARSTVIVGVTGVVLVYLGLLDASVQDSISAALLTPAG